MDDNPSSGLLRDIGALRDAVYSVLFYVSNTLDGQPRDDREFRECERVIASLPLLDIGAAVSRTENISQFWTSDLLSAVQRAQRLPHHLSDDDRDAAYDIIRRLNAFADTLYRVLVVNGYFASSVAAIDESSGNVAAPGSIPEEIRANDYKLFPRGPLADRDIAELVVELNTKKGTGKSLNQIAREYTGEPKGSDSKAKSLLASIRRLKTDGRVNY